MERVKCKECKRDLLLTDFSASTRRTKQRRGEWICWACQHPICSGAGCNVRQPIARVGEFTCKACLYPPCQVCQTTPRPQSTKYTCHNMPTWTCRGCADKCSKCGGRIGEDHGISKQNKSLCQNRLYPPCACGAPRPTKRWKYSVDKMPTWTCSSCKTPR